MQGINCLTLFLVRKLNDAYRITLPLLAEKIKINSAFNIQRLPQFVSLLSYQSRVFKEEKKGWYFSLLHQWDPPYVKYVF